MTRPIRVRRLVVIGLTALLGGCTNTSFTSGSDRAAQAPTTTALLLANGQIEHALNATFQYGAFLITIGDAVYDRAAQAMSLALRMKNIGGHWNMTTYPATLHLHSGDQPMIGNAIDVPPQTTTETTVSFAGVDSDPFTDGSITWGKDDEESPSIQLRDGQLAHGWRPATIPLDGWATIGKYSVHVTGGQILAGQLDLDAQAAAGQRILRLDFDEFAAVQDPVNGFYPIEHLTLRDPDGNVVDRLESSDGVAPVSWTATAGNWIEFPIPAAIEGDYELLVASLSPKAVGTLHPELIERVALDFNLPVVEAGRAPSTPAPIPVLSPVTSASTAAKPIDVALTVGSVNVPGFLYTPNHVRWDPVDKTATVDGTATLLTQHPADSADQTASPSAAGAAAGLLDIPATFTFSELLVSGGRSFTGIIDGDGTVAPGVPTPISLQFLDVDAFSLDDAALFIGSRGSAASSIPLGKESTVPLYPPEPTTFAIDASPATAGEWTIHPIAYRIGLFDVGADVPPGMRELQIISDVSVSPTAVVKDLGLSFRGSVELFMARSDGYLRQPVADNQLQMYQPGETHRIAVTFLVPDAFRPTRIGLVLRGGDETADVTTDVFPETTFPVILGGQQTEVAL